MSRLQIKVCGITNKADAQKAVELGADYIGLVFAQGSPRCLNNAAAAQIVNSIAGRAKTVAVFQNASPQLIHQTRQEVGFDLVQLHGEEPLETITAVAPAFKAISFNEQLDPLEIETFAAACQMLVFDRPKTISDQRWLTRVISSNGWEEITAPFLFAGGLNVTNVADTILALSVSPGFAGVDVASGIESSVGLKDHQKMEEFFRCVHEVAQHAITR